MNKQERTVPRGIRYLSNWKEFKFNSFPAKCIINKVIPGCGFTEYCLTGPENVILCSPRKMLLENKKEAHGDSVYLVRNELEVTLNYDKNLERPDKAATTTVIKNPTKEETDKVYSRLYDEIREYGSSRFNQGNLPCKILVTYDSFHVVQSILEHIGTFKSFYVIVDEFQTVMHDSKFKSDVELSFLEQLDQSHSSLFVSATPMMEEYLDMLDEFKDLPYFTLDWATEDRSRIVRPDIKPLTMMSVGTKCEEIIGRYKSGNFDSINVMDKETGQIKEIISTEAVFYVNSVNHIINVINKCGLKPEEVNILCSDTDYNRRRLKLRLKGHSIGKVPLKTEPNKMFTFCTRTVYLGADFYSKCARTFVFGDANINTLVVDISEDLAQIMGRQRDEDNPWSNSAIFYYVSSRKTNQKELEVRLKEKINMTNSLLNTYQRTDEEDKQAVSKTYETVAKTFNYRDNYVAVNSSGQPVLNKLAMIAEKRSYEIQKYDYVDRFAMFNKLENTFGEEAIDKDVEMVELRDRYFSQTVNKEKLKVLCSISPDTMYRFINSNLTDSDPIKAMFLVLDQKRIKALGYNTSEINKEITNELALRGLGPVIMSRFVEGGHYSGAYVISTLQDIYNQNGIIIKAKATDIKRWFETKDLMYFDRAQGKRVRGLKLIKLLIP